MWYRLYKQHMDHWQSVLPIPVLDFHYEELINHQERQSRTLIEFIGLDWDDNCLSSHKTNRRIQALGSWQVRQPIHNNSVARWKHYEEFLGPLSEQLGLIP